MAQRHLCIFDQPVSELADIFNVRGDWRRIEVPQKLYKEFVRLYQCSEDLHDKIKAVMEDGEHTLMLEDGRRLGFYLPEDDYLDVDLRDLKKNLKAVDPYRTLGGAKGYVYMAPEQVDGLFKVFVSSYDLLHNVWEIGRNTDYMKCIRHFRDKKDLKYSGPNSLNEMLRVYFGLARAEKQQATYLTQLAATPR